MIYSAKPASPFPPQLIFTILVSYYLTTRCSRQAGLEGGGGGKVGVLEHLASPANSSEVTKWVSSVFPQPCSFHPFLDIAI